MEEYNKTINPIRKRNKKIKQPNEIKKKKLKIRKKEKNLHEFKKIKLL